MLKRPRLKAHLHAVAAGGHALLIAEGRHVALSGAAFTSVLALIDGRRSTDDIVDHLMPELQPAEIYHALLLLERGGHLEESVANLPAGIAAFWNTLGLDAQTVVARLTDTAVSVETFGAAKSDRLRGLLDELQVRTRPSGTAGLHVAVVDDHLALGLEQVNRAALASGRPWLIVKPNGIFSWVGPLFRPGHTGCWACLAQRLRDNREVEEFARTASGRQAPYPALAALASTVDIGLGMAATEIAKWVVLGQSAALDGKVISFDNLSLQTQSHTLTRRPQCPACGNADRTGAGEPAPVLLRPVKKTFVADGGHRAASPEEMLRRFKHHISPITGIAKGLTRVTDEADPALHVYVAGSNLAARYDTFQRLRRNLRSACCGKGISDAQAQASALGESIERYSGVFRGDERRRRTTADALGAQAIDPRDCMLFSAQQYRDRDTWNALDRRLDMVPLPWHRGAELDWTPLWSLTRREHRYLPTSYCFYSYHSPPDPFYCLPDSNGSAAGTTLEEAILQGFMELVERDCVALWWYNRLSRPAVDLDSFDDPFIHRMKDRYRQAGRDLWVLDLTNDLGVPAFIALSRRIDREVEDIIFAPAAHLEARMGVIRALTELNQMFPGVTTSQPDGTGYGYDDPEAVRWWRTATLVNQPHLAPAAGVPAVRQCDHAQFQSDDLRADVELCQSIVERIGLEMLVLDQTRPDIGLPVVKVVVPGLRHFWARYAPGRLFDVPVKLGWLPAPTLEQNLNPVPIFI